MSNNRFIRSFTQVPKEIFRINHGKAVRLRAYPYPTRPKGLFDILTVAERVRPLALDPSTYEFPNGASMRPNSPTMQRLARSIDEPSTIIYAVPAGIKLPEDLILVHEFRDHYSLQAREEMTIDELNDSITSFLSSQAKLFVKDEWLQRYPEATEGPHKRIIINRR